MKIVKDRFDPRTIADGVYATTADSAAYPLFTAMKIAGDAKLLGEAFDENGAQIVTFQIGKVAARPVASNPRQMGIEQRWFQNAILDYESWREKWWRECVQNSADAGATSIELYVIKNPDNTWSCGCIDNGGGMTLDVLVNKFLVLGGTTKEGGETTSGGFGKAKELLILPFISWQIATQGFAAVGAGNQFEVYEAKGGKWVWQSDGGGKPAFEPPNIEARRIDGVHLEVLMPDEKHTVLSAAMCFVERCYLPRISFRMRTNDPEPQDIPFKADLRNGKVIEDIGDKARIHYTKSTTQKPRCIVRTREGLFMFEETLPYDVSGYIVVEMLKPSVELLTSNRDGFSDYDIRQRLRAFLNNLARNTKSALKAQRNKITEIYAGEKFRAKDPDIKIAELTAAIGRLAQSKKDYEVPNAAQKLVGDILEEEYKQAEERSDNVNEIILKTTRDSAGVLAGIGLKGQDQAEAMARQLIWTPSFIVHNELEDFRVPIRFRPEGMRASELRLIKVWVELCRAVMIQLGCKEEWGVGWVFSDIKEAAYWRYEGQHWLMLNPLKSKDEIWVPTLEEDRNTLFADAVHECTHLASNAPDHEETFTTAFTENLALCTPLMKRVKRLVESVPLRGQKELEKKGAPAANTWAEKAAGEVSYHWRATAVSPQNTDHVVLTGDKAVLFKDDSALYWPDDSEREERGFKALRAELGRNTADNAFALVSKYRRHNEVPRIRIEVAPAWADDLRAIAERVLKVVGHSDREPVWVGDWHGTLSFNGTVGEFLAAAKPKGDGETTTKIDKLATGAQVLVDAKVSGDANGIMFADYKGLAHVIWAPKAEANWDTNEAFAYAANRGMHDEKAGELMFITGMAPAYALTINDAALVWPNPKDKSDYYELLVYLQSNKRAAYWIAGFIKMLAQPMGYKAHAIVNIGTRPLWAGQAGELGDAVGEALKAR